MTEQTIRFDDGAAYEQMMGIWSRLCGRGLPRLAGAASGLALDRCRLRQRRVHGAAGRAVRAGRGAGDRSVRRAAHLRAHAAGSAAWPSSGWAMPWRSPFPADRFDAGVMALVLVFLPDPAKGIAEMVRVVVPGGMIATYMWDMRWAAGFRWIRCLPRCARWADTAAPPRHGGSRPGGHAGKLWSDAGLVAVETREIAVQRTFASYEEFWLTGQTSSTVGPALRAWRRATSRS